VDRLAPLAVAVPLLAAALVAATATLHLRRPVEVVATIAAAAAAGLAATLTVVSAGGWLVHWFGGWEPEEGIALGIDFAVDPLGAGLAALAAFLVAWTFVFGWHYFDDVGQVLFHSLMLVFLAAMVGFALTGDLFNLFVFFELVTVPAIVLTGYMNEEEGPLQGEINFAVTNTLGAFLVLTGIALLYGRTGALNLAQIGESLAGHEPDGLVVVSFVLLLSGFFVKAAIVPFHFWLADAYTVAPTPICVLFSGVMSELGIYAVARVYWTVFSGPFAAHEQLVRDVLLGAGTATALVGGVMALEQHNVKRLLAFATVAHVGLLLIGVGLLSADALAGAAVWIGADGLVRGALFMCAGILVQRLGAVDDVELRGLGRRLPFTGVLFFLGALALATLPPFGTFLGKSLVEGAAMKQGYGWVPLLFLVSSALVAGAVLRAAGVIFLGLGPPGEETAGGKRRAREEEAGEPAPRDRGRIRLFFLLPPAVLLATALALGLVPNLPGHAVAAAEGFQDREAYAAAVLHGSEPAAAQLPTAGATWTDAALSFGATAAACAVALAALVRHRLSPGLRRRAGVLREWVLGRPLAWHSGHVGDYVAWLTFGTAAFGAVFALGIR
jgi:multicomponent Na+:H+ antiporter subunit D